MVMKNACMNVIHAVIFVSLAGAVNAATILPDLRIMDFARVEDAVTSSRFEQAGFALETRLASGVPMGFIPRNPGMGLLNANGLNTVPYNGTRYLAPFTSSIVSIWNLSSQSFALKSLDVAEYSATPNLITMLRLTGMKSGGEIIESTFNINRPVRGQAGDFVTLAFDGNWSSLEGLTITASDSNFRFYNGFSMDNVVLQVVPEPATAQWMAGLAGLLAGRRRR